MTAVRRRQLTRLGIWIALATMAVMSAVLTVLREAGIRRIASLLTPAEPARTSKAPQLANRQFDQEAEQRRLSEAIRALAADRDRLLARIGALERNLEDVTGSIPPANTGPKVAAPSVPLVAAPLAVLPSPPNAGASSQGRVAAGHLATGTSGAA